MDNDKERRVGADKDLVRRIDEFERAPARERREGLTITERDAGRVKELLTRELEGDKALRRTQPIPYAPYGHFGGGDAA
jgi:hypothetical protein